MCAGYHRRQTRGAKARPFLHTTFGSPSSYFPGPHRETELNYEDSARTAFLGVCRLSSQLDLRSQAGTLSSHTLQSHIEDLNLATGIALLLHLLVYTNYRRSKPGGKSRSLLHVFPQLLPSFLSIAQNQTETFFSSSLPSSRPRRHPSFIPGQAKIASSLPAVPRGSSLSTTVRSLSSRP